MSRKFLAAGSALITLTALVSLSACSSDSEQADGGMTTCDDATISQAIEDTITEGAEGVKLISLDGLECSDGWAVAFPTMGFTEEDATTTTMIFEAEGQFWVLKDRTQVCGTLDDTNQDAYPADATIPESLFQAGCWTN